MFPTDDILDFINDEDAPLTVYLNQMLIDNIGIVGLETEEPFIFKVKVVKDLSQTVRQLRKERGLSDPPEPGDDHCVGRFGCFQQFRDLSRTTPVSRSQNDWNCSRRVALIWSFDHLDCQMISFTMET